MVAQVFTIANQKGGVGKTTTSINLGAALAEKDIPTLIIDIDPQGNATSGLGQEKTAGKSLYGPLSGEGNASDLIIGTGIQNLYLIPSEVDIAALEIEISQRDDYLMQLRRCIAPSISTNNVRLTPAPTSSSNTTLPFETIMVRPSSKSFF